MGLLDHFHPPLSNRRHWHAFHNAWATYIASDLNRQLPEGYFAEPNVQFGIEIDVAAFKEISLLTSRVSENIVQLPTSSQQEWMPGRLLSGPGAAGHSYGFLCALPY